MNNYSKKNGLPPGSLVFTGTKKIDTIEIEQIEYNKEFFLKKEITNITEINYIHDNENICWINISGLHDIDIIAKVGEIFKINSLVLEDILNVGQRPKTEFYENFIYITLKTLKYNIDNTKIEKDHVSIILGKNYVLTFQEKSDDIFNHIKRRIEIENSKLRNFKADYLAYAIVDVIVDNYFVLLDKFGVKIEKIEKKLTTSFDKNTLNKIYKLKHQNLELRKSIWPLRELVSKLSKSDSYLINDNIGIYFNDLYDHTIQIIDNIEISRDILSGFLDLYLSGISNKTNEVMKVLTIISTIFIPLTFIVGLYGMNFKYMPELEWEWGYFSTWLLMIAIAIFMIIFIKRKKWM